MTAGRRGVPAVLVIVVAGAFLPGGCATRVREWPGAASVRGAAGVSAPDGAAPRPSEAPPPPGPSIGAPDDGSLPAAAPRLVEVEADRIRLVVPGRLAGDVRRDGADGRAVHAAGVRARSRVAPADVETGGDDLSVVAEGEVYVILDTAAGRGVREGPFAFYVFRNGRELRR